MGVGWSQRFAMNCRELARTLRLLAQHRGASTTDRHQILPYGKNKVDGYLYYLQYLGVFERASSDLTPLGHLIVKHDPAWRSLGTKLLLQAQIATAQDATVWYAMTHQVLPSIGAFTEVDAWEALRYRPEVLAVSLDNAQKDLRLYLRAMTEPDAFGSLRMLQAMTIRDVTTYRRRAPSALPSLILAYALYQQRAALGSTSRSISLTRLLNQFGGMGRALNLYGTPEQFEDWIRPLRQRDILGYTRTAQLDDIEFLADISDPTELVEAYYRER